MDRQELLRQVSFGSQVAEDETGALASYFVETDQWNRIFRGDVDVIMGDKGAGKSAIHSLLLFRENEFFARNILLISGEKPRGTPVFKDIITAPPTEEVEFVALWKLYLLSLIGFKLREYDVKNEYAQKLYAALESAKLLERDYDLIGILAGARDLAKRLFRAESIEGGLEIDPQTGLLKGFSSKITLREPSAALKEKGYVAVDRLLAIANSALVSAGWQIWLLLDRLDVAFAETQELERNALRALFRVYLDILAFDRLNLKIFLRSDIWNRITEGGFREASHITRIAELSWTSEALLHLLIRRLLSNVALVNALRVEKEAILNDFSAQRELFYRVFPPQVDPGSRKTTSLDWIISRCADSTGKTAPRELIQLLNCIRDEEIKRLERGGDASLDDQLFDRSVFKLALPTVSNTRLNTYLYAEYPAERSYLERMEGEKAEQTPESLMAIWDLDRVTAIEKAQNLVDLGFFEARGSKAEPTFWVPFLYRDALRLVQGRAETDEPFSQ